MTAIPIQIVSPKHGDVLVGATSVALKGAAQVPASLAGVPLYFRWYSSLFDATQDRYSLHAAALGNPSAPYAASLGPGSQALTLGASDRPGETRADQDAIQHGGVAGGGGGASPCIIHVLTALLVRPAPGASLSKASCELAARAPTKWDKPEYAQVNRLRYRFRVTPISGTAAELTPSEFLREGAVPVLRYRGPLPASLPQGSATLTLRVEDVQNAGMGHEVVIPVTITA